MHFRATRCGPASSTFVKVSLRHYCNTATYILNSHYVMLDSCLESAQLTGLLSQMVKARREPI